MHVGITEVRQMLKVRKQMNARMRSKPKSLRAVGAAAALIQVGAKADGDSADEPMAKTKSNKVMNPVLNQEEEME